MTVDIILLTLVVALVGVVGTGVSIYASLHTVELTGKRDHYQRLVKLWKLLDFERKAIVEQSEDQADLLSEAESPTPMIISSFSTVAWQAIRANGELIAEAPQELLNRLIDSYGIVERLNITLTNYATFNVSANMTSSGQFSARIGNYHRSINQQRSILALEFRDLEKKITPQIEMYEKALKRQQKKIDVFSWGSRIIFSILAVVILAYAIYLLFWHH
jgi:hypothetical protein